MTDLAVYRDLFQRATGVAPYPYQERLATGATLPSVLLAPTSFGNTQAVLTAWLHRRLGADPRIRDATPRRLVYALPMRVLVERVWRVLGGALDRLGLEDDEVGRHF